VRHAECGFTLMELLTALTVTTILLMVAIPSYRQQQERAQLSAAASRLYSDIQQTRADAIRRGSDALNIYFFLQPDWCYRITDRSDAECSGCDALCDVARDGQVRGISHSDLPLVTLAEVTYRGSELGIQRRREGMTAGHVLFQVASQQLMVKTTGYGRLRICEPGNGDQPC
jgi:type IV fimbrial biogenesis protein FimT